MKRLILALSCMLAATLICGAIIIGVAYQQGANPIPAEPVFDVSKLTYEDNIVGYWNRVSLGKEDHGDGFREIAASGHMANRYGDEILHGTYRLLDKCTLETSYEHEKPKSHRWLFGFWDGKLIMIHQTHGWVEAYERVPVSEVHPSYLR